MIVPATVEDVQSHIAGAIAAELKFPLTASCTGKFQHPQDCSNTTSGQLQLYMNWQSTRHLTYAVWPVERGDCSRQPVRWLQQPSRAVLQQTVQHSQSPDSRQGTEDQTQTQAIAGLWVAAARTLARPPADQTTYSCRQILRSLSSGEEREQALCTFQVLSGVSRSGQRRHSDGPNRKLCQRKQAKQADPSVARCQFWRMPISLEARSIQGLIE